MGEIRYWIENEGAGHWFFIAFPVCLVALLIWFKGRRVRFLIPSLLISFFIINPWFYEKWVELGLYAYWRILWVVPVIPVIAGLVPSITERIQKGWIKAVVAVFGIGLAVFGGTFLYNGAGGSFVEAANAAKLPDYIVQIADRLLELDDHPSVIVQDPIGVYMRQYSGQIDTLFGRDIYGYITNPSRVARRINLTLNDPESDTDSVVQFMLDNGYGYLVTHEREDIDGRCSLLESVAGYGIYKAVGTPTLYRKRNELGQTISITNEKETIEYRYDERNNIIYEFRYDSSGLGLEDEYGIAGIARKYDIKDRVVSEIALGKDGNPVEGPLGYAEIRRVYQDDKIVSEQYYDEFGNPTENRAGVGSFTTKYNGSKLVCRQYFNTDGSLADRNDGYSYVDWSGKDMIFYNIKGESIPIDGINLFTEIGSDLEGWSEWITPETDVVNYCISIGRYNLGENKKDDIYSCQIEIEFKNVKRTEGAPFLFRSQGDADGNWNVSNVWTDCVLLEEPPQDGIYQYSITKSVNPYMVDIESFDIAFRCDYWADGSFRVRRVKIEKNDHSSDWSPGI